MITNTQAIVVQTRKFRDNDRQVVLLSRELGKIQTVAWNAQKKHSTLMSFCQIFNLGTVSLSKHAGKSFSLRQAQCENIFRDIKKDNLKFAASCFFVESLDRKSVV